MDDLLPSNNIDEELLKKLNIRSGESRLRSLSIQNKDQIDFASNDYLGLSKSFDKSESNQFGIYKNGNNAYYGSTGSRLISGNFKEIQELEHMLAEFHKSEKALILSSGYSANLSLFSTLPDRHSTVIYDELMHASMRDGIRLGCCKSLSFKHNDVNDLKRKLKLVQPSNKVFISVESLYSMDGDYAPLDDMVELCKENQNTFLIVDEAHTTGVLGEKGEGLVVGLGLEKHVYARVHTFGKAYGCHGGAIVGSNILINYIINFSRQFIYTTGPSPESIQTLSLCFERMKNADNERKKLFVNEQYAGQLLKENFNELVDERSAYIKYILIKGGNKRCKEVSEKLNKAGIFVRPILSPTVKEGSERLRICLHSFNTFQEIDYLINELKKSLDL